MANRNREHLIKFYVNDDEKKIIEDKMSAIGIDNISAYMRSVACNGYIVKTDFSELKNLIQEINKIGININQITKRLNETNHIYKHDMDEIKKGVAEIWHILKLNLSKLHQKKL